MPSPLIITVAAVGAELTRAQQPHLPITPAQVGEDAAECERAGASIYHLHVRDGNGEPTMDVHAFEAALFAIKENTDLIVQFTTGGAVGDSPEERIAPLELRPEMASLTPGSVNFGDEVFLNPLGLVKKLYARMTELSIVPEFEIFEPGMIATAERIYDEEASSHRKHYDFVLNVPGAMPAWPDALDFLSAKLPSEATWSATGIGKANSEVAKKAIELGGHVRTGFEDVLWVGRGEIATSNAQLVERIVDLAGSQGREIASPTTARNLLGLA